MERPKLAFTQYGKRWIVESESDDKMTDREYIQLAQELLSIQTWKDDQDEYGAYMPEGVDGKMTPVTRQGDIILDELVNDWMQSKLFGS